MNVSLLQWFKCSSAQIRVGYCHDLWIVHYTKTRSCFAFSWPPKEREDPPPTKHTHTGCGCPPFPLSHSLFFTVPAATSWLLCKFASCFFFVGGLFFYGTSVQLYACICFNQRGQMFCAIKPSILPPNVMIFFFTLL